MMTPVMRAMPVVLVVRVLFLPVVSMAMKRRDSGVQESERVEGGSCIAEIHVQRELANWLMFW